MRTSCFGLVRYGAKTPSSVYALIGDAENCICSELLFVYAAKHQNPLTPRGAYSTMKAATEAIEPAPASSQSASLSPWMLDLQQVSIELTYQ